MKRLGIIFLLLVSNSATAHQPIMDMAPRWEKGYGAQTRVEYANSETTTWLEGVYTFKPSVRMTLKVPFTDGDVDNAIFAVPLKRYRNEGAFTSNWGITPSVRMPTGNGDDWDAGLGLSYSAESLDYYQLYDLYRLGDDTGLDINVGLVHKDGGRSAWFTLWDVSALDRPSGERILSGPVVMYYRENIVWRAEFKHPLVDHDRDWDGNYVSVGVGVVY